jgi:broad specificity phosphatase PhoE
VIGLILCRIYGSHIDDVWQYRHENTAFTVIRCDDGLQVLSFNNSEHLTETSSFFEKWKFVSKRP